MWRGCLHFATTNINRKDHIPMWCSSESWSQGSVCTWYDQVYDEFQLKLAEIRKLNIVSRNRQVRTDSYFVAKLIWSWEHASKRMRNDSTSRSCFDSCLSFCRISGILHWHFQRMVIVQNIAFVLTWCLYKIIELQVPFISLVFIRL